MKRPFFRCLTPLLLVISLLAPLGGGAVAGLLGDARTVVICTGDGLRSITLDADGNPVETSQSAEFCALVHAADTAAPAQNGTLLYAEFSTLSGTLAPLSAPRRAPTLTALPRAPPRA